MILLSFLSRSDGFIVVCINTETKVYVSWRHALIERSEYREDSKTDWDVEFPKALLFCVDEIWPLNILWRYLCTVRWLYIWRQDLQDEKESEQHKANVDYRQLETRFSDWLSALWHYEIDYVNMSDKQFTFSMSSIPQEIRGQLIRKSYWFLVLHYEKRSSLVMTVKRTNCKNIATDWKNYIQHDLCYDHLLHSFFMQGEKWRWENRHWLLEFL